MSSQVRPNNDSYSVGTSHALSERSILQNRDVFLFYEFGGTGFELRGGLDTSRHNLSIATLYRWLNMLDHHPEYELHIWPINVKRSNVFRYVAQRDGLPLPRSSTKLIPPGNYGLYTLKMTMIVSGCQVPYVSSDPDDDRYMGKEIGSERSYATFEEHLEKLAEEAKECRSPINENAFGEVIKDTAHARDGGICFIQGVSVNNTELAWLVPPTLARWGYIGPWAERPYPIDLTEEHTDFHNVITLDEKLYEPFMGNRFGIDVEDNYKIIIFQDFPGSEILGLKPKLPLASIQALTGAAKRYLQENFKYCLGVNLLGGDIREDHPDHGVAFIADIADNGWGSPLEERWKTPLGREVLDYYKDRIPATFRQPLQ